MACGKAKHDTLCWDCAKATGKCFEREGKTMKEYDATEQAYKNGYEQGKAEAIKEFSGEIKTEIEKAMRIDFTALQGRREKLIEAGATEKDLVNDDIVCWLEGQISAFKAMGYFVELLAEKKGVKQWQPLK